MRVQQGGLAHRGHLAQRLRGDGEAITDPAAIDDHMVVAPRRDRAGEHCDHLTTPASWSATARASGARFRSHTATASASDAWSEPGDAAIPRSRATIFATWS